MICWPKLRPLAVGAPEAATALLLAETFVVRRPVGRGPVLAGHESRDARIRHARPIAAPNPIAAAMVERAAAVAAGDTGALLRLPRR